MPTSPKQLSRGETTPQSELLRRGMAFACVLTLACVFAGTAFAQTASMPILNSIQPVSEARLQPAADADALLPEEPSVSKSPAAELPRPYPGDIGFVPLRGGERVSLFFKGYLASPVNYLAMAASASASWIAGEPDGWGRTLGGYGQRAGNEFVLYTAEEALHDVGDAALGLDPRYFPCRCSGLWRRSGNALKMTLLAYDGNGKLHLDLPRFAGDYGSSMLVTSWYPASYSPLVQGVRMGHVQIGLDAGANLLREFSPELKRVFRALKLAKPAQP